MAGLTGKITKKGIQRHITHANLSKIIRTHEKKYAEKGRADAVPVQNSFQLKGDDPYARF